MHTTSLHQESALPVTRGGKSRAQQATPWTWLGTGAADSCFPEHLPFTWTEIREAWEAWEKLSGKSFLTSICLISYCIAISKLPHLGEAWDKPSLSKTFHWQEGSLLGMSPLPNKPDGSHLLVLELLFGAVRSQRAEKPLSQQVHTHSVLSYCHTQLG